MMNRVNCTWWLLLFAILFQLAPSPVIAATITVERNAGLNCEVFLRGEIAPGDADALSNALDSLGSANAILIGRVRVCLDSPGGSYPEGIKIARLLLGLGRPGHETFGSAVPSGAVCYSACAVAFMAGTLSNEPGYLTPDRVIEPGGRVGFHAPMLTVPSKQYSEVEVLLAYNVALASVSEMIGLINSTRYNFPSSLLEQMLKTPHDEMLYIETFAQAFNWQIDVATSGIYQADKETLIRNMCEAADARLHGFDISEISGYSLQAYYTDITIENDSTSGFDVRVASGFGPASDPGHTLQCLLTFYKDTSRFGLANVNIRDVAPNEPWGLWHVQPYFSYPPSMKIDQVASQPKISVEQFLSSLNPSPAQPKAEESYSIQDITIPLSSVQISSFWDHNGSQMALVANGDERSFYYSRPRSGLLERGVLPGTLLFQGRRDGGLYKGVAVIFGPGNCGAFPYEVTGSIGKDQRSVTLLGTAPRISTGCSITGYKNDELLFTLE